MRLGFVTCVKLGLSCMEAIYAAGGELVVAFTLTDDRAVDKSGRVFLDDFCRDKEVPLCKISHVNDDEVIKQVEHHQLDWLFIIGWSQIANAAVLNAPQKGVLGMHPTLLPKGRGRASIPWAIIKGLEKTGVTLFKLDEGVDTGPILNQKEIMLHPDTTATSLYDDVEAAHYELMEQSVKALLSDTLTLREQDNSESSEWPGRKPEDGEIDINGSIQEAERLVRAVTHPYPGAFYYEKGVKVIVWSASIVDTVSTEHKTLKFSDGILQIDEWE